MVVLGNLRETALPEVLSLLSTREGLLEIWGVPGQAPTGIYLAPGRIRHIVRGGKPLPKEEAKVAFYGLLAAQEGRFEFIPGVRPPFPERLGWPLERVLLGTLTLTDELRHYQKVLPPPQTRFRFKAEKPLEKRFQSFFQKALPYLKRGATALELSQALRIPVDLVRYYLYRLQAQGVVVQVGTTLVGR